MFNLAKRMVQLQMRRNRIYYSFARYKSRQDVTSEPDRLPKKIHLTFSALYQIQKRKPSRHHIIEYFTEQNQWKIQQKGHIFEFSRKFLNNQISVVFKSHRYPIKQIQESNTQQEVDFKLPQHMHRMEQENQQNNSEQEESDIEFTVYIRKVGSPTYLIVNCLMSSTLEGLYPYSIDFTTNKEDHILKRQTPLWNPYQDLSDSLTHHLKRYLLVLGVSSQFGAYLSQYNKHCLKNHYMEWLKNMKQFVS